MLKEKYEKIFYIMLTVVILMTFVSCEHSDVKPVQQVNTIWVSENPDIFFTVTEKDELKGYNICYGILKTSEKNYNISMEFGYGFDSRVNITDYDILKKNNFIYKLEAILVRADCKFSEKKCTLKVTESSIDGIEVDDKITFKKVDELPDWATEAVEATVES